MHNPTHPTTGFDTSHQLTTEQGTLCVESSAAFWEDTTVDPEVRLDGPAGSLLLLAPAEALAVAAALQAVAVHLLEQGNREEVAA